VTKKGKGDTLQRRRGDNDLNDRSNERGGGGGSIPTGKKNPYERTGASNSQGAVKMKNHELKVVHRINAKKLFKALGEYLSYILQPIAQGGGKRGAKPGRIGFFSALRTLFHSIEEIFTQGDEGAGGGGGGDMNLECEKNGVRDPS